MVGHRNANILANLDYNRHRLHYFYGALTTRRWSYDSFYKARYTVPLHQFRHIEAKTSALSTCCDESDPDPAHRL